MASEAEGFEIRRGDSKEEINRKVIGFLLSGDPNKLPPTIKNPLLYLREDKEEDLRNHLDDMDKDVSGPVKRMCDAIKQGVQKIWINIRKVDLGDTINKVWSSIINSVKDAVAAVGGVFIESNKKLALDEMNANQGLDDIDLDQVEDAREWKPEMKDQNPSDSYKGNDIKAAATKIGARLVDDGVKSDSNHTRQLPKKKSTNKGRGQ
ncbi:MAG: hypothetical protein K0T99_02765 [Alphaproteobacteria bacterium]|nr:hypothetical protein [Alphaproteobacteria bacterium]